MCEGLWTDGQFLRLWAQNSEGKSLQTTGITNLEKVNSDIQKILRILYPLEIIDLYL